MSDCNFLFFNQFCNQYFTVLYVFSSQDIKSISNNGVGLGANAINGDNSNLNKVRNCKNSAARKIIKFK